MGPTPYYNNRTGREVCALRYSNIGTFDDINIDLVIKNISEYYPNNVERNGINGQFGRARHHHHHHHHPPTHHSSSTRTCTYPPRLARRSISTRERESLRRHNADSPVCAARR